jgi:hypothetical protein
MTTNNTIAYVTMAILVILVATAAWSLFFGPNNVFRPPLL